MRLLVLSLFLSLSFFGWAQRDKVYLSNGSVLIGDVTMSPSVDSLAINLSGQTFSFPIQAVDAVVIKKAGFRARYKNQTPFTGGYSGAIRGSVFLGGGIESQPTKSLALSTYHGYQYKPWLNLSLGTGYYSYDRYQAIPVFLRYHLIMGRSRIAPMLFVEGGYGWVWSKESWLDVSKGGLNYAVGLGWQRKIGTDYMRFELGVQRQKMEEVIMSNQYYVDSWIMPGGGWRQIQKRTLTRASFSISYVF
ncbi:hypothetical protein QWY31_10050 [Cytophagales bacterium LB-30]|uniref:Outer membrane protein beta-barrel domain-containing protein n=1 Tax=Shiella aurantiaca TaxID=3058365 RepID=A0ABT8F5V6_9BACT|nr:hypothetical protein [Shiella aurantiaca]MDN4165847.1 hypothetical protein [Shiella aurantiaca]